MRNMALDQLKTKAIRLTDNQAAQQLKHARQQLFQSMQRRSNHAA
jgi:hypothetical protein